MSFWTGLEAFTGHKPGAFTGFSMKDLFEKDMWEIRDRLGGKQSRQFENTGVVPTTAWYKGMGRPEMMGDVVRRPYAGVPVPTNEWVNPNTQASPVQMNQLGTAQAQTRALPPRPNLNPQPVPGWTAPRNPAEVIQETGRYYGMGDPYSGWGGYLGSAKNAHMGMGASGYRVPPVPQYDSTMGQTADMTTVRKITDDASPNTITQTIKQQVPANPTKTLMNMNQPGFLEKLGSSIGEQWGNLWDGSVIRHGAGAWDAMKDLSRKRHEEEMLRRQRGY